MQAETTVRLAAFTIISIWDVPNEEPPLFAEQADLLTCFRDAEL
jgi:hypothetical protein